MIILFYPFLNLHVSTQRDYPRYYRNPGIDITELEYSDAAQEICLSAARQTADSLREQHDYLESHLQQHKNSLRNDDPSIFNNGKLTLHVRLACNRNKLIRILNILGTNHFFEEPSIFGNGGL